MFAPLNLSNRKASQRLISGQPNTPALTSTYTNTISSIGYSGLGSLFDNRKLVDDAVVNYNGDTSCNCCGDDGYGNCNACSHYFYCGNTGRNTIPDPGWYVSTSNYGFIQFSTAQGDSCGGIYCYDGAGSYDCCNVSNIGSCWTELGGGNGNGTYLGIRSDNTLWSWGSNGQWLLGEGNGTTTAARSSMVQIGSSFSNVRGSQSHAIAVKTDGTLWSWGYGGTGLLGQNNLFNRSSPTQIGTQTYWTDKISCGDIHTLAISNDGKLWAWGENIQGQLGDNSTSRRSSPVQIGTGTDWDQVFCGYLSSFAIKTDGTLWAWGYNGYTLGDGTNVNRSSPVQIGSATNWKQVFSTSTYRTYAIAKDGTMWAWGTNPWGISAGYRSVPTVIGSLSNKIHAVLPQACNTDGLYFNTYIEPEGTTFIDTFGNVKRYCGFDSVTSSMYTGRRARNIIQPKSSYCNTYIMMDSA